MQRNADARPCGQRTQRGSIRALATREHRTALAVKLGDKSPSLASQIPRIFLPCLFQARFLVHTLFRGVVAHILRDFHRAEMRAAHRTKVRELGAFLRQGFIVELLGFIRVEAEIELIVPAEFEAGFG